ncbi:6-phosphogluconolactonase [compost metagenome]
MYPLIIPEYHIIKIHGVPVDKGVISLKKERYFYVGTYAEEHEDGIYLCRLNLDTGELQHVAAVSGIKNPSFLALNKQQNRLYAVSETGKSALLCYKVETYEEGKFGIGQQALTLSSRLTMDGQDPCHLTVSEMGQVYVVHYSSAHVNSYAVDEAGDLQEMISQIQHTGGSGVVADRQGDAHAHQIRLDPTEKYAYVSDLGMDAIVQYELQQGMLKEVARVHLPQGTGPRHLVFHPQLPLAYGINELNNTITAYHYDVETGSLKIAQHVPTLKEASDAETISADIHVSVDGKYVYGSNRGADNLVQYRIDTATGLLHQPTWTSVLGEWPRNFAIQGEHVLVANQYSNEIVSFRRNVETGELTSTGFKLAVKSPTCILFDSR